MDIIEAEADILYFFKLPQDAIGGDEGSLYYREVARVVEDFSQANNGGVHRSGVIYA
jgi:hypothetical protein